MIHYVLFWGKDINIPSMSMENVWNTLVTWETKFEKNLTPHFSSSDCLVRKITRSLIIKTCHALKGFDEHVGVTFTNYYGECQINRIKDHTALFIG